MAGSGSEPAVLAVFGEICTALLPTSTTLRRGEVAELLEFTPAHLMHWRERPISRGVSASKLRGVDCSLAVSQHPAVRAIGTIASHAVVVGGRLVQASASSTVTRAAGDKRVGWAHYLGRPGTLEVLTRVGPTTSHRLAEGFLTARGGTTLDLTSVTARLLGRIGMRRLGRAAQFRMDTTRLRWAARVGDVARPQLRMRVRDAEFRTALVVVPSVAELDSAREFCEDLAIHDWLLTAITGAIERADLAGPGTNESTEFIGTVLGNLGHLWMPGAHTPPTLRGLWTQLADDPDFSGQWHNSVDHLRNRMLSATWHAARSHRAGVGG